jgi:NADH-quinone oxidoreductase subunit J
LDPVAIEAAGGNTYVVAMKLLTNYIWPFELASVLILMAIVAAVVIAKKDKKKTSAPIS